nr:uncharacterized protein LOC112295535 isoform X2 [Physcomitrium patens]|eukprot:XP_024403046.1 uncharacterized protein LOC112295535 isoform X2 [Physcomitrella patens]
MTSSVPKKFVGKGMADSMSSSVDDDDNSLDGRNSSQGDRSRSIDTSQVHLFPTVPKTEEKPRRRSSRPTYVSGDSVNHFTGSDPVRLELARLENELKEKLCPSERCTKPIRVTLVRDLTQASSSGESMVTLRPVLKETMLVESLVCPE